MMPDSRPSESARFCWLRLRRHEWRHTGSFRFGPGQRGHVLHCEGCGYEIATAMPEILDRAKPMDRDAASRQK